jgi:two-component system, NarL family, sensor histidine kinase UhpB
MLDRLERERRESARIALAAQEQERLRIARELHDEVGQVLTGVMLELDQPRAREAVRRSLEDVRRIARELRPEALDHLGLQSAMRSLCISTAGQAGLRVVPEIDLEGIAPRRRSSSRSIASPRRASPTWSGTRRPPRSWCRCRPSTEA